MSFISSLTAISGLICHAAEEFLGVLDVCRVNFGNVIGVHCSVSWVLGLLLETLEASEVDYGFDDVQALK